MGGRHGRGQQDHDPGEHALEARRPLDRRRERCHRLAVHGRRPREDPPGQRDGLRPSDAPPLPRPRCRAVPDPRPRRRAGAQPDVERHRARADRGGRRHPARRHQPGPVDGPLPHRRAPRERDDVELQRRARGRCPMTDLATEHHRAAVTERHEVVVVGGGQSGLAIGHFLKQQGRDFTILEAAETPAAAWRERWDSLRLFTPGRRNGLPGRPFPGDPARYPGRDEVVAYLTDYARDLDLPVALNSRVRALRAADGGYLVELDDRAIGAEQVVIATGPWQVPTVPAIAERFDPSVIQFHSTAYRNPQQVPDGPVLVVGGGNTGYQIAEELMRTHEVHLSVGARQTPLPQRILGRDLFTYLETLGLIRAPVSSRLGSRLQKKGETLVGSSPRAARGQGIRFHGRTVDVSGREVRFADGAAVSPTVVIWATGFRLDHSFVDAPVFDSAGALVHERGVTSAEGLYFLGLLWQHTRGSALLGWVRDDAKFIAQRITQLAERRGAPAAVSAYEAAVG